MTHGPLYLRQLRAWQLTPHNDTSRGIVLIDAQFRILLFNMHVYSKLNSQKRRQSLLSQRLPSRPLSALHTAHDLILPLTSLKAAMQPFLYFHNHLLLQFMLNAL